MCRPSFFVLERASCFQTFPICSFTDGYVILLRFLLGNPQVSDLKCKSIRCQTSFKKKDLNITEHLLRYVSTLVCNSKLGSGFKESASPKSLQRRRNLIWPMQRVGIFVSLLSRDSSFYQIDMLRVTSKRAWLKMCIIIHYGFTFKCSRWDWAPLIFRRWVQRGQFWANASRPFFSSLPRVMKDHCARIFQATCENSGMVFVTTCITVTEDNGHSDNFGIGGLLHLDVFIRHPLLCTDLQWRYDQKRFVWFINISLTQGNVEIWARSRQNLEFKTNNITF